VRGTTAILSQSFLETKQREKGKMLATSSLYEENEKTG